MRAFVAVIVLAAVLAFAVLGYLHLGNSWQASARESMGLFASKADAAYSGSSSIKTSPALGKAAPGEAVSVLWDTYGKDYWACYVRLTSGQRGWVLCTSLNQQP